MALSRISFICILGVLPILLAGCDNSKDKTNREEKIQTIKEVQNIDYCEEVDIKKDETIVYNIFKEKLGIYNKKDYSWSELYEAEEEFAYRIEGMNEIYTVGNTSYNHFSIMQNNEKGLHKILDIDEKDSILPFGEYKDEYYFIYNIDDLKSEIHRKIVKYNKKNKKLVDVLDLESQLVASAIIVEDVIYYTPYQKEKDSYELYQYNLTEKSVQLVSKNLPTDFMYNLDGNLAWNDGKGNILDINGKTWCKVKQDAEIDYNSEFGLFFQVYPDENNSLACDIICAKDGEILTKIKDFIGYEIDDFTLILYCDTGIKSIDLK